MNLFGSDLAVTRKGCALSGIHSFPHPKSLPPAAMVFCIITTALAIEQKRLLAFEAGIANPLYTFVKNRLTPRIRALQRGTN
jgi:hypothetical protein